MEKILKFVALMCTFAFVVGCCAKKVPGFKVQRDIPIEPASVVFIVGANAVTGEQISGSAIVVESKLEL